MKKPIYETIFEVREYNKATNTYELKDSVTATSSEEAKEIFIKENKWKPRKNIVLFVKPPNCK